mgnify:CR=1 FL=1
MQIKRFTIISLFICLLFGQNIWTGNSVATSDNLDVFSLNPAGLGVFRGVQQGIYIPVENENFNLSTADRYPGFGYSFDIKEDDPWYDLSRVHIGFGTKMGTKNYLGLMWTKNKAWPVSESKFKVGTLIRPWSFLSFGGTITIDEDNEISDFDSYRIGGALRPFASHRLTIGADYSVNNLYNTETLLPFAEFKLFDGVNISFSTAMDLKADKLEPNSYQLNVGFSLNKAHIYTVQDDQNNIGLGFYTDTQITPSIFNKKKKDSKKYIRMKLSGSFIEEKPRSSFFGNLFSSGRGIQLRTWLEEMQEYTEDPDVDGLIIDLGSVGGGLAKKNEMRRALQKFKDSGKEIIVYSEYGISSGGYFLTAMADKIFISGSTGVDLKGINVEISFYRTLLDTLSIVPEVFRVNYDGKSYKTAGDPLLNKSMSSEMRENYTDLFQSIYDIMVNGISEGRGWTIQETKNIMDNGPYMVLSKAKEAGIVDSIMYVDQFEDYVKNLNDGKNTIVKTSDIDRSEEYVYEWVPEQKEKIAVIYAVGSIMPGNSNPGPMGSSVMGDKTINKAIKSARRNKDIKAIVLRIDSGGGSALASDNMWREIYRTTTEDTTNTKPFIASMSDVAASGGYYIACEADSILADEATITGSIGVIGLRMNFSELKKRIGINTENIMFGENADFGTGARLITDSERERMQESINESYTEFKDKVAQGRYNIDEDDDLDQVAMGRVFTGSTAATLDMFLVDKLGGLHDAIETAKNTAGIKGDVEIVEYPKANKNDSFEFDFDVSGVIKNKIINELPEEFKDSYDMVELITILSKDEKQMILPYKIEIK